jgi:hypothetical protein
MEIRIEYIKTFKQQIQIYLGVNTNMGYQKTFNTQNNIGSAKYVVNYFNGKTHNDGSSFFDIAIFKNKIKKDTFINGLLLNGFTCN